ncbi:MAG: YceI family protein [Bacteroidetes bacterium]|nr:YceI family protein [Bacteroidota bacterium]
MFKKLIFTFLLITSFTLSQSKWTIDATHSNIKFSIVHLMISEVEGNFKKFEGEVLSEKEDFTGSKVNFTIEVNSINTDNEMRDNHLKSDDFFSAQKYPTIKFEGTSFTKISDKKYKLSGNLTMRDITKPAVMDVTYFGTIKDGRGNLKAGFKALTSISRKNFGVIWDKLTEAGGVVVSDNVDIVCNIQLRKN